MRKIGLLAIFGILAVRAYASPNNCIIIPATDDIPFLEETSNISTTNIFSTRATTAPMVNNHIDFFTNLPFDAAILRMPYTIIINDLPENLIRTESFLKHNSWLDTVYFSDEAVNGITGENDEQYGYRINIHISTNSNGLQTIEFLLRRNIEMTEEDQTFMETFIEYIYGLGGSTIIENLGNLKFLQNEAFSDRNE